MTCDDAESALEAWGVGLLDRDERRDVETHLAYCAACAEQAASLRRIIGRLSTAPARVDAAALEDRILARAFGAPRRSRFRLPAAAAAGLLLGLLIPWGPSPPPAVTKLPGSFVTPALPAVTKLPGSFVTPAPRVEELEESPVPELPPDVPPSAPAAEAVAYSWEEAADLPWPAEEVALRLWGVELEARGTFEEGSVHAGAAFAGWSRDDGLGGAALVGLCLRF